MLRWGCSVDGMSAVCVCEGRKEGRARVLWGGVLQGWTLGGDGAGYLRGMSHGLGCVVWLGGWLAWSVAGCVAGWLTDWLVLRDVKCVC